MKKKIIAFFTSFLLMIPVFTVPVRAANTVYTYPAFLGSRIDNNSVNTSQILGFSVNFPSFNACILSRSNGTYVNYAYAFFVYAVADTPANAESALVSQYQYAESCNITYSLRNNDGVISSNTNHCTGYWYYADTPAGQKAVMYYCLIVNNNSIWTSAYGYSGTDVVTSLTNAAFSKDYIVKLINMKEFGISDSNYAFASWAGGWLSDSETDIPIINMDNIAIDGNVNGTTPPEEPTVEPTEEPTVEPTEEPTEEPTVEPTVEPIQNQQQQQQQIAEGAVQVTNNSSIESDAVTVNVSDGITEETVQRLDQTLQNNNPYQTTFTTAVQTIDGFRQIGVKFAQTSEAFLDFLPSWVTDLLSLMFVLLFFFIVLRLLRVFHG